MRRPQPTLALLAAALAMAPGMAQAAEPPCLTSGEFTALATYALPSMVTGTAKHCAATLSADAFLKTGGPALAQRYAGLQPAAWPSARIAFLKIAAPGDDEPARLVRALPDQTLQSMVDGLVGAAIAEKLPAGRCLVVDSAIELFAELPPEKTANLIGVAVGLGSRAAKGHLGKIAICTQSNAPASPPANPQPSPQP